MPYRDIEDLPPSVRDHLPRHAQEIFVAAFNHAWQAHADDRDAEGIAFRIAWSAVKKGYRKAGGSWVKIAPE
ncbi:ChaB family protein [Alsobacter sp. KACC 23698]|uniref:ChaB family protein n=1 Tax=Alsobacter sp. KACC 23698 TaxID=3149229 RepID=A0AAU7JFC3_9HYPH